MPFPSNGTVSRAMRSSNVFKIVIGQQWRDTVSGDPDRFLLGAKKSVDFARVRGAVDIVVDGTSICGRTDEDSIFFLMRDLLSAVERLSYGAGTARVSFYEGPWELVLQRLGSSVYITFYRGGRRPQVIVKNHALPFAHLRNGVLLSSKELMQQASEFDPMAANDPLVVGIGMAIGRIEKLQSARLSLEPAVIPEPQEIRSTRWREPRSENGFSFGFQFDATATDLLSPGRPKGSDLNALLFAGQHVVHARGKRLVLGKGFLFLQTEKLLSSLRQLLTAWEDGRPMSVRLISEGLVIGVRLGSDDGLVVSLMDSSREDAILVLNNLTPWEYADAVLGVARELRRLIVDVNSYQRRNLRLEAFSREVKALSVWVKEQRSGDVINENVDRYRHLAEPRIPSYHPFSIGEARRLRFDEKWRIEVEGLDLHGTALCGDVALISARRLLLGIDADSGAVTWRRDVDSSEVQLRLAGPDGVVRAAPSGQVELIDLYSGVRRWETSLSPRTGGSPVLLVVDHGPAPGLVITAEEDRKLVALDVRTGEPRWRFAASRGGKFSLRRYGRLLYTSSSDTHFNAVDIEDGTLVWRFTDRTRFVIPPAVSGDTVLVVGGRPGRPEGRVYALDAFSGKPRWNMPIGGGAMASPIIANDVALIPIRSGRKNEFIGIDISTGKELWRMDCAPWGDPSALMALDNDFIVNSARGCIRSIRAQTGEERWSTTLEQTCSDDVPFSLKMVLRGGMLFVPSDTVYVVRPEDGTVIHSMGNEIPVPDLIQVDPACSVFVAEDSGHIAMYALSSRLTVVS